MTKHPLIRLGLGRNSRDGWCVFICSAGGGGAFIVSGNYRRKRDAEKARSRLWRQISENHGNILFECMKQIYSAMDRRTEVVQESVQA